VFCAILQYFECERYILMQNALDSTLDSMAASLQNLYHDVATKELLAMPGKALDKAEEIARRVWTAVHHKHLPAWLRDNDFLLHGHRPQLHTFTECFRSIFRIHTETGNIWTHLIGQLLHFISYPCKDCFFLFFRLSLA